MRNPFEYSPVPVAMQADDLAALRGGDIFYVIDRDAGSVLEAVVGGNDPDVVVLFTYQKFHVGSFSLSTAINQRRVFETSEESPYYKTKEDAMRALND